MGHDWHSRAVDIRLPLETARTLWRRALQWDVAEGGRYEVRTCRTMLIWPGLSDDMERGDAAPIGSVSVRWNMPTDDQATITRVAWHPSRGSQSLVWHALEVLAGRMPVAKR